MGRFLKTHMVCTLVRALFLKVLGLSPKVRPLLLKVPGLSPKVRPLLLKVLGLSPKVRALLLEAQVLPLVVQVLLRKHFHTMVQVLILKCRHSPARHEHSLKGAGTSPFITIAFTSSLSQEPDNGSFPEPWQRSLTSQ